MNILTPQTFRLFSFICQIGFLVCIVNLIYRSLQYVLEVYRIVKYSQDINYEDTYETVDENVEHQQSYGAGNMFNDFNGYSQQKQQGYRQHSRTQSQSEYRKKEENLNNINPSFPKPYKVLGLKKLPKEEKEIKTAYRKLAKKYHPDAGGDGDMFAKISEAYKESLKIFKGGH